MVGILLMPAGQVTHKYNTDTLFHISISTLRGYKTNNNNSMHRILEHRSRPIKTYIIKYISLIFFLVFEFFCANEEWMPIFFSLFFSKVLIISQFKTHDDLSRKKHYSYFGVFCFAVQHT